MIANPDKCKGTILTKDNQSINQSSIFTHGSLSSVMPVLPKGRIKHHSSFIPDCSFSNVFLSFNLESSIV